MLERSVAHATPTCTSRKRAGAAPWETAMTWPGSPLPQLVSPHSRHGRRRADGVERAPEARRDARVGGLRYRPPSSPPRISRHTSVRELELQAAVVDRPRAVGLHVHAARRCRRSGPRACRPSPGSSETLVIRTIGWRAKPSARAQPPEAPSPIGGRALAVGQRGRAARRPRSASVRAAGTPSSSQPNEPRPPGSVASAVTCSARSRSAASRGRRATTQLVPA